MSRLRFTGAVAKYPARSALGAYVALIAVGALLLSLPVCHADPTQPFSVLDAIFTSTSAVCVTGLSLRSVGQDFSFIGQCLLLVLIQLGGIGIITVTTLVSMGGRAGVDVRRGLAVSEALGSQLADDPRRVVRTVIAAVLGIESVGFVLLFLRHLADRPPAEAAWQALFHSVSAFCNAGFGLFDDSLIRYRSDVIVNITIGSLIILGGLGFPVLLELFRGLRNRREHWFQELSLHTRLVLWGTAALLAVGTLSFLYLERHNTLADRPWPDRLMTAGFHAITCRSAGFNTVEVSRLTDATLFVTILLMLIGAAPCSTGGGIKVSTFMVLLVVARDKLRGYESVRIAGRTLSEPLIDRALPVVLLFLVLVGVGLTVLLSVEQTSVPHGGSGGLFIESMFEVVSAACTVGLSTGLTTQLDHAGRLLLIPLMLIGRLGPFSLFVAVSRVRRDRRLEYVKEDVLIG